MAVEEGVEMLVDHIDIGNDPALQKAVFKVFGEISSKEAA